VNGARSDVSIQPGLDLFQNGTAIRVFTEAKNGEQYGLFESA